MAWKTNAKTKYCGEEEKIGGEHWDGLSPSNYSGGKKRNEGENKEGEFKEGEKGMKVVRALGGKIRGKGK